MPPREAKMSPWRGCATATTGDYLEAMPRRTKWSGTECWASGCWLRMDTRPQPILMIGKCIANPPTRDTGAYTASVTHLSWGNAGQSSL